MLKHKSILLIFLLMLCCCNSPNSPDPDDEPIVPPIVKEISVDIRYLRKDDTPKCPQLNWDDWIDEAVYLQGLSLPPRDFMQKLDENLYFMQASLLTGTEYNVCVLDYAFTETPGDPCYKRAHDFTFNGHGVPKDKIHGYDSNRGEYVLVTFDVDGVPSSK